MTFKEFAREHNLTITYSPTGKGKGSDPLEFYVLLHHGEKLIWSGSYTLGIGIIEREAQKLAKSSARRLYGLVEIRRELLKPLPSNRRRTESSNYYRVLREAAKTIPDLVTVDMVLESLQMDVSESDMAFEDWANEYGYEPDSLKAYRVWETCNNYRRTLRSGLGETLFETFLKVSDEND